MSIKKYGTGKVILDQEEQKTAAQTSSAAFSPEEREALRQENEEVDTEPTDA